jgi:hypothetical protein
MIGSTSRNALTCAVALMLTACGTTTHTASDVSAQNLPDWSGWWDATGRPFTSGTNQLLPNEIYLPEFVRLIAEDRAPGANLGGGSMYCVSTRFNGANNGGGVDHVEFLLMPERLTITNENGLLRRIPIDGRALRENPEFSNGGTSVGKWQGDTLVIETIGLHPDTTFPTASRPNSPVIGDDVHVLEHIGLNDQQQLVVETWLSAPQMLLKPINFTVVYERTPGHIPIDHDVCSLNDRSIDPVTGFQRFDMTPPVDLPPPPPN